MHVGLDKNTDAANTIELNLLVLISAPVTHLGHVVAAGLVLLVAFGEDNVITKGFTKLPALVRLNPGVVIDFVHVRSLANMRCVKAFDNLHRPSISRPFWRRWNQMSTSLSVKASVSTS